MTAFENIVIREAAPADVARLVELNRAAYPDLIVDDAVFSPRQIEAHIACFPRGQLVAESGGKMVGAMSTFIPAPTIPVLKPHTWLGITDGGLFLRHDPAGRALYLADIYVDPSVQRRGVGRLLYGALQDLCRSFDLDHVVAGGRLWGYGAVADTMTPEDYVGGVLRGTLTDPVLGSQLRAGFVVRGILKDYLHDWRSKNYATLLEWVNPAHAAKSDGNHARPGLAAHPPLRLS
ncbi:MAG TPA: GNAT family N-acetyltransferase [Polyangiaceae bacterium]|jgi:GNAT superfamily N-acetyltransferase|nr:GNAT family N-acetyltransferase [Polyangiaceae bacterium]